MSSGRWALTVVESLPDEAEGLSSTDACELDGNGQVEVGLVGSAAKPHGAHVKPRSVAMSDPRKREFAAHSAMICPPLSAMGPGQTTRHDTPALIGSE